MSVLVVSDGKYGDESVLCVICLMRINLTQATAGSLYADGHQAFACNQHLFDRTRWINEWAVFDASQHHAAASSQGQETS
jgi:hypothetical protein